MKRDEFLKRGLSGLGMLVAVPIINACTKTGATTPSDNTVLSETGSTNGNNSNNCVVTNSETAGPFPTKTPTNFVINDITSDRKGVEMTMNINIKNKATGCGNLEGAMVDVWYCDADGNYSQYGNAANANFLRGRQATDANGMTTFKGIFPGWYNGRAPHVHVHIYSAAGKSLLVTQIAFPKTICDNVYSKATDFYKKGLQDTTNERDGIFSDGYANELCSISGSIADGYKLEHTIVVTA